MNEDKSRPRQLGRGLEALFGEDRSHLVNSEAINPDTITSSAITSADKEKPSNFRMVQVSDIRPNVDQPRRDFNDLALQELASSIGEQGVLQPLIVRFFAEDNEKFEIVAGERRWRAAQLAQVHEVPVIIRDFTDSEALAVALIENIQRNALSPLEEADAYSRLANDFKKTQEEVAEIVGKSRSHVANMVRLLDLPIEVKQMLMRDELTMGHARAILNAPDMLALARRIIKEGLNVRETERLRKSLSKQQEKPARKRDNANSSDTKALEKELGERLGTKVKIYFDGTKGYLKIKYKSLEQFDEVISLISGKSRKVSGVRIDFDASENGLKTHHSETSEEDPVKESVGENLSRYKD